MLNAEKRRHILNEFLSTISGISDLEYQKRVWILAIGPEVDDFGETVNFFFDLGEPILKDYKSYGISENQYQILSKFRNEFDAFKSTHFSELEFIDTPEWATITAQAKDVLRAFNYT